VRGPNGFGLVAASERPLFDSSADSGLTDGRRLTERQSQNRIPEWSTKTAGRAAGCVHTDQSHHGKQKEEKKERCHTALDALKVTPAGLQIRRRGRRSGHGCASEPPRSSPPDSAGRLGVAQNS